MSFVSIIATENFLNIVSDGRVTGENKVVLQEDYRKFISPTRDFFVAYAGNKEPCEAFVYESGLLSPNLTDMNTFTSTIAEKLQSEKYRGFKILLAFGGKVGDCISFATFSTLEPKIQFFTPKNDDICYTFLNNSSAVTVELETKLIEALRCTGYDTPEKTIEAQTILNNFVAGMDDSVNCNTFPLTISR